MFVKLLVQYLEKKDPEMHARAKETITKCAREHKNGNPMYASLSDAMAKELKMTVGESHWKRAHDYFTQLVKKKWEEKKKREQQKANGQSSISKQGQSSGQHPQQQAAM